MKIKSFIALLLTATVFTTNAQEQELTPLEQLQQTVENHENTLEKLKGLKVSGYIQPQFQMGEQSASLKVGTANTDQDGNKIAAPFNRFGIRRGRLKFTYDNGGIASGVFQLNITDKPGLSGATIQLKEAYLNVKDPWINTMGLRAGVFDRPFGNEISYSSSLLESTERSKVIQAFFPEECDLGAMVILQPAKTSQFNFIKFEGGLFAGNAINPETDNKKDFIGHIVASKTIGSSAKWGFGVSYYNGGVYQTNNVVYSMNDNVFTKNNNTSNTGAYAKREYYGIDGQFSIETTAGMTQVRAEYMAGTQPGTAKSSTSPNRNALPEATDTYIRPAGGWYAILVQDLGQTPFSAVVKYDVYDPNTHVSGNEIGVANSYTSATDLKYSTLGFGALWRINPSLHMQVYYEMVQNEASAELANSDVLKDYSTNLKDNIFTLRLQFKF
ncbi:MAG: hypothetical protein PHH37_01340 [Paludibacter sp.]|nr:hypothetical protein [Paludibacter sp.]